MNQPSQLPYVKPADTLFSNKRNGGRSIKQQFYSLVRVRIQHIADDAIYQGILRPWILSVIVHGTFIDID